MTRNNLLIVDEVKANELIEHEGYLIVRGNIGYGAVVKVTCGQLIVRGNVGDRVRLKAEGALVATNPDGSEKLLREGTLLSQYFDKAAAVESRIVIQGRVGENVCFISSGNIFVGKTTYEGSAFFSGGVVFANVVEAYSEIQSESDVNLKRLAGNSQVTSKHGNVAIDETIGGVLDTIRVEAAKSFFAHKVSGGTIVYAGESICVATSDTSAKFMAPSVKVCERKGYDGFMRPVKINMPIKKF